MNYIHIAFIAASIIIQGTVIIIIIVNLMNLMSQNKNQRKTYWPKNYCYSVCTLHFDGGQGSSKEMYFGKFNVKLRY